jgi:flavin reductase (DIM6/NTAB) family NADH-FMN oxidoreductase RutF
MDLKALYKLTYGLYLLSARQMGEDNGCIINTAVQVTSDPAQIAVTVLKANKTHDMVKQTGAFALSTITQDAPFSLFQHFGMQSGRDVKKFEEYPHATRTGSTIYRLSKYSNMYLTAVVTREVDLGTHTMFIADITDCEVISDGKACTYEYYQDHIKPKPKVEKDAPKQWVCAVCGYVYEGEEVPDDYICPWCQHGKEDFEPLN